jgi:hypothetical protein
MCTSDKGNIWKNKKSSNYLILKALNILALVTGTSIVGYRHFN